MDLYQMPVYRPPSEANSLLVQVTHGCSYNKCIFCYMYKGVSYKTRSVAEVKSHINDLKKMYRNPKKAFLVGGDVFALDTSDILEIIKEIKNEFPMIERISSYCSAINVMKKSKEDLTKLREAGVSLLYLGIESGSDVVLEGMCKGVTKAEQLEACKTLQAVGFDLSVMVISGLGGKVHSTEHALESADIISKINPKYFSLLSLEIRGEQYLRGMKTRFDFEEMTPSEIIDETILMLGMIETKDCVFRSNHASNYVRLAGTLSDDKEELIKTLHEVKEYYFK